MLRILLLAGVVALSACTKKSDNAASTDQASTGAKIVNLAIWSNYLSDPVVAEFTKQTGIRVEVSNYSSNEELLAKLQAGATGYDVIVPSDYMVFAMAKLGLIRELDYAQLPNAKSLDPRYLKKQFDPSNKYSVPYTWGTTGLAVNRKLYKGEVKGWKTVFSNPALAGKFTMLDDVRETTGAALKSLGFSLNTTSPDELRKAKALLMSIKPKVKAFSSEPRALLEGDEAAVTHVYSTDALQAARTTKGRIEYIIPEEGCTLWIDNLVIPATAPHMAEAHAFINFLLEAKTNAATVTNILVAPANKDTHALLSPEIQGNKMLFPTENMLAKCEMMQDVGEALSFWDRIWTEVKAGTE